MKPTSRRPRLCAAILGAGLLLPATAQAADPVVSTAPGRIVLAVDSPERQNDVDAGGASFAVALPDGGALLLGGVAPRSRRLYVVKVDRRGAPDRAFGTAGVASVAVQASLLQVLRQPDGKLLLVGAEQTAPAPTVLPRLQVTRLNADITLDSSFGAGGTVTTPLGEGCGACTTAALQPDDAIVLTGTTGAITNTKPNLRWVVARLTPAGAADGSFASGGIATIPTADSTSGFNVALGPGGSIVAEGQSQADLLSGESKLLLTRLTRHGALDPEFAGGNPVTVPFTSGFLMRVLADGSVVLNGQPPRESPGTPSLQLRRQLLARYTPAGALDAALGSGGIVDLGADIEPRQLLAAQGRSVAVVGTPAYGLIPGSFPRPGRLNVRLLTASGAASTSQDVVLPFGGGGSSFLVSVRPRPVASILQNSFTGSELVARADGSYIVAGGVRVTQPTGEGAGFSIGRFAAASLTPSLQPDTSFGGPATPLRLSIRLLRQRAATASERHGIRVELRASQVGLARVKITHGRRAIAHSLLPVFTTSRHTLPVQLTRYGNSFLRRHRNLRVTISATGRDLLTNTRTARARGRLR